MSSDWLLARFEIAPEVEDSCQAKHPRDPDDVDIVRKIQASADIQTFNVHCNVHSVADCTVPLLP